jgi:hypothetical protein
MFRQSRDDQLGGSERRLHPERKWLSHFPPLPPPRDLFQSSIKQFGKIAARKFGTPQAEYEDKPLYPRYRFYELVVIDSVTNYRNCL